MKIVVITRERIETLPPVISMIEMLDDLGVNVQIIACGITDNIRNEFERRKIEYVQIDYCFDNSLLKLKKVFSSLKFRKRVLNVLKKLSFDCLIIEGQGAFKILGTSIKKYNYIMYILEMYTRYERYIKKLIYDADAVIMPQYDRAVLYQTHYQLKKRPYVLPNKPYFILDDGRRRELEIKYRKQLQVFKEKKVILYQGIIHKERNLTNFIKAVKSMGDSYRLVLLGKDSGAMKDYIRIDPFIVHIEFIPAPDYLVFTANAYIGILTYDPMSINCAYCAPNKLFEYAKYSLPMLGNDIPGLKYTIEVNGMGEIIDENSQESIVKGIKKIDENYSNYANKSFRFYQSVDCKTVLKDILNYE